jgi:hypothetical protein
MFRCFAIPNRQDSHQANYDGSTLIEDEPAPLLYYRGQYRHLASDRLQPSLAVYTKESNYVEVGE